jgi:hypothetical protein
LQLRIAGTELLGLKESFTKETIISAKRWKSIYKTFRKSLTKNTSLLRNPWGIDGQW